MSDHIYQPTCPKAGRLHHCARCRIEGCLLPPEEHTMPNDEQSSAEREGGRRELNTETVELPWAAVAMLLAAGRAVYHSASLAAQRGGTHSGLRHQWELAQAINAAERALFAEPPTALD
jgi:hypothetical protein